MNAAFKLIIIIIVCCSVSFFIGYEIGERTALSLGINILFELMERQKISIEIDEKMLRTGIYQYKNNIGNCLFLENSRR